MKQTNQKQIRQATNINFLELSLLCQKHKLDFKTTMAFMYDLYDSTFLTEKENEARLKKEVF